MYDDLCDVCGRSDVEVDHTHDDGSTVCTECAEDCDHLEDEQDETLDGEEDEE